MPTNPPADTGQDAPAIRIRGARTHNLKNIDLDLPRERLIVITGLSGSGKSSLAFDTLYAEGQRRYVESLSAYARQFLSVMEKPDIDHIDGLSPAISIEQKSTSHNPRSTVGTVTEIYDYLRLLFARVGTPRCPEHGTALAAQTVSQIVDQILAQPPNSKHMLLAPIVRDRKGEHGALLDQLRAQGYLRVRIDGHTHELDALPDINPKQHHDIDVVVDRFKIREGLEQRLAESVETTLDLADGLAKLLPLDAEPKAEGTLFSARYACPSCGYSLTELEPKLFSFNNPAGACPECSGLGNQDFFDAERVVANPHLSLAGGAIRGWDRRNAYYFHLINSLAKHYDFDIDQPFEQLALAHQDVILNGSGRTAIDFTYVAETGRKRVRRHRFEGVLPNMQRRYRETESNTVREELSKYLSQRACPECHGSRLNQAARHVYIGEHNLAAITALSIDQALATFAKPMFEGQKAAVADKIIKEIHSRLKFLANVGLNYLSLDRSANTLSGGEAQRIRLASQIGAGLVGVMYVLDEPSIGLHQRDNSRLLDTLTQLRDLGNTVIVVEHDEDAIRAADHLIDIGPAAGIHGGQVIAQGSPQEVENHPDSPTGAYLSGRRQIILPAHRHAPDPKRQLNIKGARGNNLKNIDVAIPIGLLSCITGVSGSGKSTLINATLKEVAARELNGASALPAEHDAIEGLEQIDKMIAIDQSPIGRTPRSNPATYTGLFTPLRELFAGTQEARSRGYKPGRFSFNVKGGRCEACRGDGLIKVEMHFLPDVYVPCEVCDGKRYNRETLDIRYKGLNIDEVLQLTIEDAAPLFDAVPAIHNKLQTLLKVGLGYIRLGQSATTLSGGEAQRVKLAKELAKRDTGKTLYILDEPTTGLHFHDIDQLLSVLHTLRDHGNTVLVIEHNLDVIKTADWVIDLGPEGGSGGGRCVASGTPEQLAQIEHSHTGRYLAPLLASSIHK